MSIPNKISLIDVIKKQLKNKNHSISLKDLPQKYLNDRDLVLCAMKGDGYNLKHVSDKLRNDKEIVMQAVKSNGYAIEYASEKLKNDKEIALAAIKQNINAFNLLNNELKNDREIMQYHQKYWQKINNNRNISTETNDNKLSIKEQTIQRIKNLSTFGGASALSGLDESMLNDKDIVLCAVKRMGWDLKYANDKLKDDRDVVYVAVQENGFALQFASERLKDDKEIVPLDCERCLEYASERLKDDKEIVMQAVKSNGYAIEYASERLRNDKEVALAAVNNNVYAFKYVSEELKNDREILLNAVNGYGYALDYVNSEYKKDKEIMLNAILSSWPIYKIERTSYEIDWKDNYGNSSDSRSVIKKYYLNKKKIEFLNSYYKNDEDIIDAIEIIKLKYGLNGENYII